MGSQAHIQIREHIELKDYMVFSILYRMRMLPPYCRPLTVDHRTLHYQPHQHPFSRSNLDGFH